MRVKHVLTYLSLPEKAKLVWDRLTFSKVTTAYILFSLIHCFVQLGLQARAFTINAYSASSLFDISLKANAYNDSVPFLKDSKLYLCPDVPTALGFDSGKCQVVWNGTAVDNNATNYQINMPAEAPPQSSSAAALSSSVVPTSTSSSSRAPASSTVSSFANNAAIKTVTQQVVVTAIPSSSPAVVDDVEDDEEQDDDEEEDEENDDDHHHKRQSDLNVMTFSADGHTHVNVSLANQLSTQVTLSSSCAWSLNWPVSVLDNTKREDVVFMAFQIWVLGMSFVALLNESIPHIIASLLTHVLATAWASFQIVNTAQFQHDFSRVITKGACNEVPQLVGAYWIERKNAEYASLALNIVALFVSGFLSWKLFKSFGWQTFKRVGASLTINRIYKLVLVLSIVLQLSLFFMGATVGLWIDDLINGVAAAHGEFKILYRATSFATMLLLVPWVCTGYVGVRKELRIPMISFLLLSILYLAAWSVMFVSHTFLWTFLSWRFFSIMATASVALTIASFLLGIVCRLNFGKGLPRYLNAQEPLPGDDFAPVYGSDPEKVEFPSNHQPIPTFSAAFGKGSEVPVPSQMFPSRMGPRFFRTASEPFDSRSVSPVTAPSEAHTRSSVLSSSTEIASYYNYSDDGHHSRSDSTLSESTMQGKRWVIE